MEPFFKEEHKLGKLLLDYQTVLGFETLFMELYDEDVGMHVVCVGYHHKHFNVFGSGIAKFWSDAMSAAEREALKELVKTYQYMDGGMVLRRGDLEIEMKKRMNAELEAFRDALEDGKSVSNHR